MARSSLADTRLTPVDVTSVNCHRVGRLALSVCWALAIVWNPPAIADGRWTLDVGPHLHGVTHQTGSATAAEIIPIQAVFFHFSFLFF